MQWEAYGCNDVLDITGAYLDTATKGEDPLQLCFLREAQCSFCEVRDSLWIVSSVLDRSAAAARQLSDVEFR